MEPKLFLVIYFLSCVSSFSWKGIVNLPDAHIPYFFNNNHELKNLCNIDDECPYKRSLNDEACWGYEEGCAKEESYSNLTCPDDHKGWVKTKEEQIAKFFRQGDFGYVKHFRDTIEVYCSSDKEDGSILKCSENMQFCWAKNIYMDFTHIHRNDPPFRYSMEVLKKGHFGGNCKLDERLLKDNSQFVSPLQSWAPELRYFTSLTKNLVTDTSMCDVWITKPAVIAKIDASVSMYHHFCDFFNLYASQHVNNSFETDSQIIIWETYPYRSNFADAWKPFTKNPIQDLSSYAGKKVCFKDLMLPLPPRMVFGLYYNTPIIWGCEGSGLFHAFSHHMIHRLKIPKRNKVDKIHVTLLSRLTAHRRILNEDELVRALQKQKNIIVKKVEFKHSDSFIDQLKQDQQTDILVGIHGSGLTHLMFLPDWAVVFELYDCGDPSCYQDMARLRGLRYISWEDKTKLFPESDGNHPDLGPHEKFTNYSFDVDEFVRLIKLAVRYVKKHPQWKVRQSRRYKDEL